MADPDSLDAQRPSGGPGECLEPIRGRDEVEVEGPVADRDEVLAALDVLAVLRLEREPEIEQRRDEGAPVLGTLLDEQDGVLGGVRIPEQDGAGLPYEELASAVFLECPAISCA